MHLQFLLAFASQALSLNFALPHPIGPSLVGTTSIELLDTSRLDPFAPDVRYQDYTATLTNLASQGYIVVGVDHPFDTGFIEYPDNRTAIAVNSTTGTPEGAARTVDVHVADLRAVLDALATNATFAKQIPGVHGTLDVSSVGVFGHSLGGATGASAMAADERFACGINLDGTFWGSVVGTGVDRPFFLMSSAVHNQSNDDSWKWFVGNSTGMKLEVAVEGSLHGAYTDFAVLYDEIIAAGYDVPGAAELLGTIRGARMLEIVGEFAGAWFDRCLQGKREVVLEGPSEEWPEVKFWDS
ncbi:putative 1-alkyl-2-acetylglycerophosphocholine esterase [Lachnellula hyalina]|uniref:1-alkyl-2-acetylglycerophosphocholine esterase n=1 Tax=Lachnellula hyalina TaxID=1316788 RepID=A0A8H8RAU7_9HELO|nr:putative 1-alkyl-2-acetylglycerophosphocholine esterase [Lachnellula hyalina]TVY30863.1 putative 1-alkyl-2-acetylglycerophosphocholine esterase [Lachnellula hyalina]